MKPAIKDLANHFKHGNKSHYINYVMSESFKLASDPNWGRNSAINVQRLLINDIVAAEQLIVDTSMQGS